MGKLWRRVQGLEEEKQPVEVSLDSVRITAPTLVYLSGFLTNNNRPDFVSGSIKAMERLIKDNPAIPAKPEIYGWSHSGLRNLFNLAVYDMFPATRSSRAGYDLGRAILMPLVTKDFAVDVRGKISGKPLLADEAKKNLKNVTFFGYSAGAIVAQETYNATLNMMKKVGYEEEAARDILQDVTLIATGCFSRTSKEKNRFTTVYLVATNDRLMRAKNWMVGTVGTALRTIFGSYSDKQRPMTIRPLSETSIYVTTPARATLYEWTYNEKGEREKKRHFAPLYPKWLGRRSYHELNHYITRDESNNKFANIAYHFLANALMRTEKQRPLDLICSSAENPETDAVYNAKIADALRPAPKALERNFA